MMTKNQGQALAAFVAQMRDDWDAPGILAQLAKVAHLNAYEVSHALLRLAENSAAKTPGALTMTTGEHWREKSRASSSHPLRKGDFCRSHPGQSAANCGGCNADRLAGDESPKPARAGDAATGLALARAELRGGAHG
jgi:hypothetical protein